MLNKIFQFIITVLAAVGGLMMTDSIIPYVAPLLSEEFLRFGIFGVTMTTILSFAFGGIVGIHSSQRKRITYKSQFNFCIGIEFQFLFS